MQLLRACSWIVILNLMIEYVTGTPLPENLEMYVEGTVWIGTQSLTCLKGKKWFAKREAPPSRFALTYRHRLMYYRNQVYEWSNHIRGYHVGSSAFAPECEISWESHPVMLSTCPGPALTNFTIRYRADYGGYNLLTNNCHHFINRALALLASNTCTVTCPDPDNPDDCHATGEGWWARLGHVIWNSALQPIWEYFYPTSGETRGKADEVYHPDTLLIVQ